MQLLKKLLAVSATTLFIGSAIAAPSSMTTHNQTSHQSNAYIAGSPSIYPVDAGKTKSISWYLVRLACWGHTDKDNNCDAEVFMETETNHKVSIGKMSMNLTTGDINPLGLDAHGYHLVVNGPGEVTITEDK